MQVKHLEGAHASCEDDMAARNYTIQQLEVRLEARGKELDALTATHEGVVSEHAAGTARIEEQAREIEQITGKLETFTTYTRELTAAQQQLASQHAARKSEISVLEDHVDRLKQRIAHAEAGRDALASSLEAARADAAACQAENAKVRFPGCNGKISPGCGCRESQTREGRTGGRGAKVRGRE